MPLPHLNIDEQTRLDELLNTILETASTVDDVQQYLERSTSLHLRGEVARGRRSGKTRHPDDGVHGEDGGVKKDLPLDLQHSLVEFLGQVALRLGEMPALSAALAHVARRMATRSVESRPSTAPPIPPAAAAPVDVDKSLPLTPPVDLDKTLPWTPPAQPSTPQAAAIVGPPSATPSEREVFLAKILIRQAIEDAAPLRDALSLCAVFRFMRSRALSTPRLWANVTGLSPAGAHHLTYILSLSRLLVIRADLTLTTADHAAMTLSSLQTHIQRVQHLSLRSDLDSRHLESPIRALFRLPAGALESLDIDLRGLTGIVSGALVNSGKLKKLACKADQLGLAIVRSVTTFRTRAPASEEWMSTEEHTLLRISSALPNVRSLTTDLWFQQAKKPSQYFFAKPLLYFEAGRTASEHIADHLVQYNLSNLRANEAATVVLRGQHLAYSAFVPPKQKGDVKAVTWFPHNGQIHVYIETRTGHQLLDDAVPLDARRILTNLDCYEALTMLSISEQLEPFLILALFKSRMTALQILELLVHKSIGEGTAGILTYARRTWTLPGSLVTLRLSGHSPLAPALHAAHDESLTLSPTMDPSTVIDFISRNDIPADDITLELAGLHLVGDFGHEAAVAAMKEKVKVVVLP